MWIGYIIDVIVLILLLLFTFSYQTERNQERIDSRFELASHIFKAKEKSSASFQRDIETVDEFLTTLKDVIHAYYGASESGSAAYLHYVYGKHNLSVVAPLLEITYHEGYYGSAEYTTITTKCFDILEDNPLGPLANISSLITTSERCDPVIDGNGDKIIPCRASLYGEFFDRLISMKLSFSLYSLMRNRDGSPHPRVWWGEVVFRFVGHRSVMSMEVSLSDADSCGPQRLPVMICSALLPLVTLRFLLRIRTFSRFSTPIWRVIRSVNEICEEQPLLSCCGNNNLCPEGGWRFIGFFSDILVLMFSVLGLLAQFLPVSSSSVELAVTVLLGFSTLFCCIQLVSILVLFPTAYVVVNAIVTAGKQLSVYAVAVFPILLGYSFCGLVMFGSYGGYFATLPLSMVSLLCANFGDNLIDTFIEIDQSSFIVQLIFNRIFFFTFLLLFICNVLNIAHSIIQDSYSYALQTLSASVRDDKENYVPNVSVEELSKMIAKFRG